MTAAGRRSGCRTPLPGRPWRRGRRYPREPRPERAGSAPATRDRGRRPALEETGMLAADRLEHLFDRRAAHGHSVTPRPESSQNGRHSYVEGHVRIFSRPAACRQSARPPEVVGVAAWAGGFPGRGQHGAGDGRVASPIRFPRPYSERRARVRNGPDGVGRHSRRVAERLPTVLRNGMVAGRFPCGVTGCCEKISSSDRRDMTARA